MIRLWQINLDEWDQRYDDLKRAGLDEPSYGGPLRRHLHDGDLRLKQIKFDSSPQALRLWNFLLTEEERLKTARQNGKKIIGTMKDLGTVPVIAYAANDLLAFYPDGAWWIPCVMELSAGLLGVADSLGLDESFCPVRAMIGAFVTEAHFPIPDLLICSVGATCDDFSAIAQRLNGLGHPIHWWEIPHRRKPQSNEPSVTLPGGMSAPKDQVDFVMMQLEEIRRTLSDLSDEPLDTAKLSEGIASANRIRRCLDELRQLTFTAEVCPIPALEVLIAEMLAIHFCSDRDEALIVLQGLVDCAKERINRNEGYFGRDAARIFWINPVADLRAMNILEDCGGRICGTEYLFTHALDEIPEDLHPMEALARTAMADPMIGSTRDRSERIISDIQRFGSEGLIVSRIPGASHCAVEGKIIAEHVKAKLDIPVIEIEVPPVCDSIEPTLRTRLTALVEIIKQRRHS